MSSDLYKTMLFFDSHGGGFAKAEVDKGIIIRVDLPILPELESIPEHITEMYVYPGVRDYRLRESAGRIREMEPPERRAINEFLSKMAEAGRRLLGLQP
jgi:hypothetical protein